MGWHMCARWTRNARMPCPFAKFDDEEADAQQDEGRAGVPPLFLLPTTARERVRQPTRRGTATPMERQGILEPFIEEFLDALLHPQQEEPGEGLDVNTPVTVPAEQPALPGLTIPTGYEWPRSIPHGKASTVSRTGEASGVQIRPGAWQENMAEAVAGIPSSLWSVVAIGVTAAALAHSGASWSSPGIGERQITQTFQRQLETGRIGKSGFSGTKGGAWPDYRFRRGFRKAAKKRWQFPWNRYWSIAANTQKPGPFTTTLPSDDLIELPGGKHELPPGAPGF